MDIIKFVRAVAGIMAKNSDIAYLEVSHGGMYCKLSRLAVQPASSGPPASQTAAVPVVAPGPSAEVLPVSVKTIEIKAPMVGTFYRAPSPDAEPFIKAGDEITPDKVLCIIEAMKMMNEISMKEASVDCRRARIVEIKVENAQPVEFSQVLFVIEVIEV